MDFRHKGLAPSNSFMQASPISAVKFIRQLKGSSRSSLIQCDDGLLYVVKTTGDGQKPNLLANEVIGSALADSLGLPVPQCRSVYFSDDFLNSSGLARDAASGGQCPTAGVHYGSQLIGCSGRPVFATAYLSPCRVPSVINRDSFLGVYLLDLWANHLSRRQAIFIQPHGTQSISACFIDHGHMFGGPRWEFDEQKYISHHFELSLYYKIWNRREVAAWTRTFEETIPQTLERVIPLIPPSWFSGNIVALQALLLSRLNDLDRLFRSFPIASLTLTQGKSRYEELCLSNSRICEIRSGT